MQETNFSSQQCYYCIKKIQNNNFEIKLLALIFFILMTRVEPNPWIKQIYLKKFSVNITNPSCNDTYKCHKLCGLSSLGKYFMSQFYLHPSNR